MLLCSQVILLIRSACITILISMVELDAWKIYVSAGIESSDIIDKCKIEKEQEVIQKDENSSDTFRIVSFRFIPNMPA